VRQDKGQNLRERLRRGARSFDFDALIQGVSTVEPADEDTAAEAHDTPAGQAPVAPETHDTDRQRLRAALETLGARLLAESGKLAAACRGHDAEDSGYYLARVNQVLELLESVDPGGETARRLQTVGAPPDGRSWPLPVWTTYELAESPLGGLLPSDADEQFAAAVIAAAVAAPQS